METQAIEMDINWDLINQARQELIRVYGQWRFAKYETPEQGVIAGEVAESVKNAEEGLFNVLNVASSHEEPGAKTAMSQLGPGLAATSASERLREGTTTTN